MMKNNLLLSLIALSILLFRCSQGEKKQIRQLMKENSTICYQAINEKDTGWFQIDTSRMQIIGVLTFKYNNGKKYDGEFKGKLYGDTLMGYFDLKTRKNGNWYRNPVAFLKRKGKLIMGVGSFVTPNWGSPYFDDQLPIYYDRGKFIFEVANSKYDSN